MHLGHKNSAEGWSEKCLEVGETSETIIVSLTNAFRPKKLHSADEIGKVIEAAASVAPRPDTSKSGGSEAPSGCKQALDPEVRLSQLGARDVASWSDLHHHVKPHGQPLHMSLIFIGVSRWPLSFSALPAPP